MRTIFMLACIALLSSCSSAPTSSVAIALPEKADAWTLASTAQMDYSAVPTVVEKLGFSRGILATYTGPATVTVRVFEMKVATSAFELIQQWRQQDGLAVYTGPYFIVADPVAPGAAGLLEALRRNLK
jgi:hypothetical protein